MIHIKLHRSLLILLFFSQILYSDTPQITIVFVVDQLTQKQLEKMRCYLLKGFGFFLKEGIIYTEAHTDYACPKTGTGHATLGTGTIPALHGIISNNWPDEKMNLIDCDYGDPKKAAVFGKDGLQPYGKSPDYIMVDALSDQLVLQEKQHKHYKVFSLSMKSRSAICTANRMGKAVWFDTKSGMFTSSKAYFDELPEWIKRFNIKEQFTKQSYTWNLYHKCLQSPYYNFKNIHNYKGTHLSQSLIGTTYQAQMNEKEPYEILLSTPAANKAVFDLALACIDAHFCSKNKDEKLFLWVCPSSIDKVGHMAGTESLEVIDMIYHLDYQLKKFMDAVSKKTRKRNILWALTSDHGVSPLPEHLQEEGYSKSIRIDAEPIKKELNATIKAKYQLNDDIVYFVDNTLYLNKAALKTMDKEKKDELKQMIANRLENEPGIQKVWLTKDLKKLPTQKDSIARLYQNQLFKNRSGSFSICPAPYCFITQHAKGANHSTPYNYDTQIPLIIYQRGSHQRKTIDERVHNTQLAPTLAYILQVPRPSACKEAVLPGIIFKEDCCF